MENNTSLPTSIRALKDSRMTVIHEDIRVSNDQQRTIVICLDGTGDRFDSDNSNVVHFVSCLKKDTPDQQVTYYQSGIGTYDEGGLQNGIGAAMDMAVGSGLGNHIKDAYRFLMQNYRESDKICLLGFSRGAYTVRCLAGMLHKVGLLPAGNVAQINFAYAFYKDDSPKGWKMSAQFKSTFCIDVNVYFVGVWDCVANVGFIPRTLPFSHSPTNSIHYFRHAMALDEHRSKFDVSHWRQQNPGVKNSDTVEGTSGAGFLQGIECLKKPAYDVKKVHGNKHTTNGEDNLDPFADPDAHLVNGKGNVDSFAANPNAHRTRNGLQITVTDDEQERLEAYFEAYENSNGSAVETDALEVWFMGAHADIGGGAVGNDVRHQLSRIPLRWMFRQCFECNTGILFDTASLIDQGLDIHTLYPVYQSSTQPACGPPPALLDKYEKAQVPPLRWRRALFSIGDEAAADKRFGKESPGNYHLSLLSEGTEDHFDAMAPINDQLAQAKIWWVLEFWPIKLWLLATSGVEWVKKLSFNLGRYRAVRETEPKMHWTVQHMIDEGKYTIKTRTHPGTTWKVVA